VDNAAETSKCFAGDFKLLHTRPAGGEDLYAGVRTPAESSCLAAWERVGFKQFHSSRIDQVRARLHSLRKSSLSGDVLKRHDFTGCGKARFRAALYQGTTSVVPISRLSLARRADFSPRGLYNSDFFRSLFSRAAGRGTAPNRGLLDVAIAAAPAEPAAALAPAASEPWAASREPATWAEPGSGAACCLPGVDETPRCPCRRCR